MLIPKNVFKYLLAYSCDPIQIDRLIITAFLYSNNIKKTKNIILKNLLIKEGDLDFLKLNDFLEIVTLSNIEQLIELFEFVISPEEKVITGAVYTPKFIREYIISELSSKTGNHTNNKICDPACGCGGFLYTAAKKIREQTGARYKEIFENNIYGLDIQQYSVNRTILLLSLLAVSEGEDEDTFNFNIYNGNALSYKWAEKNPMFSGFEAIIGNPPYVCSRNIDSDSKQYLSDWRVCSSGHPDLYIPFFEIGLTNLKNNGFLGFITMNTFFKSVNGRALREYFQEFKYDFSIIDFGSQQVFNSKSTYTCVCLIQKKESGSVKYVKVDNPESIGETALSYKNINYSKLDFFNGWNMQEVEKVRAIEATGTSFGQKYKSSNGIATLKNNIYIFDPIREDKDYFYLKNDNLYQIEKGICIQIINPNKLTKTNSIESLKKKIIFPYYYEGSTANLLVEDKFQLLYPKAYAYLKTKKDILAKRDKGNGKYENWYAYGRNQNLSKVKNKLFFPHIASSSPNFVINSDENLLFYNGLAILGKNEKELLFVQKLMSSRLFWFYIVHSSKPYGSGYYSLSRNYFKNFGIYDFTDDEIDLIINEKNTDTLNRFIESKYEIKF